MLPALLLLTLDAHAVIRQVGGGGAYNTITSAVAAASLGDTILITAGRYTESVSTRQNLTFEASGDVVWLEGASAALSTTNATVLVRGVRFEVSRQRCVDTTRGTVTLDGVTCTTSRGGQTALDGFGVRAVDTALTLVDTELYDLQTTGFGGGVNIDGGSLTVTRGHLHDLSASRGGAVYANGTRVTIDGALFTANHAIGVGPTEWGGALSIVDPTALHVATSHFVHNQAYAGGDIDLSSTTRGAIEVLGNSFDAPVASGSGGALRFTEVSGAITVTGNLFCEVYSSGDGGGALLRNADATWTNNVHIGAYAPGGGGGLFVEDSTLTVVNNTFVDLYGHLGGAVDAQGGAVVDFRNNLVAYVGDYDMITVLGGVVTPRWTALYQNDGAGVAHGPNAVLTDPRMIWFTDDGLCNDDVRPAAGSPLINAGDPSIRDLDGSRSDIGAYGGPGAVWLAADADGDGFAAPYDCDDLLAAVSPNAAEVCDGADNDCDGQVDAPANPAMPAWYLDQDGDGFGTPLTVIHGCTAQPGYVATADDCDDRRSGVHPGAPESCDGTDEDCNGTVDDGTPVAGPLWYVDGDGDGHGGGAPVIACTQPAGLVALGDDCDDVVADAHPGASELCNGVDDDCDRQIDEGNPAPGTWYTDSDGDGHGDPATSLVTCAPPAGWVGRPDDCDDHDDQIFPGAAEHCDDVDEDCDDLVDEDPVDGEPLYADLDGDRWGAAKITACRGVDGAVQAFGDCDDADDRRHPGAQERCNDNDLDCDGLPGNADGDSDGFAACDDCDDADPDAFPGAPDAPYDGELLDCDRVSDNDADGDGVDDVGHNGLDCDDADPAVFPGASEPATSTVDLDCDGVAGAPVVEAPEEDAGCACDAGGGGSAWWWLVAAGLVRRRR